MLHQIGVGALGPVFRTYEPNRDRLVAVKVFRLDVTPEQAAALAEELGRAANAGLFHSSIVEPVAAGVEGTVAYRAEEYVAAESLDVAMRHYAPATIDKALPFITQLASAIDFAREAGVGHGALHPRDIFVTPDEARATGFGVVDALERVGQRAPVRRPYSPPERIAGQPWNTTADVFSLAAIAFELLTGRRPSGLGENMGSLSGATLGDHADEIRAVLARGMNEKPAERYATARAFSAALAKAAAVEETAPSPADRTIVAAPAAVAADPDLRIASDVSAPAGTALPDLSLAASLTTTPAASDLLIKDAAASAVASTEGAGDGLDDFGGELDSASSAESPRELARKMIAAREVRKRQVRKKPERPLNDLASEAPASDVLKAESKSDVETDIKPELEAGIDAGIGATDVSDDDVAPLVEASAKVGQPRPAVVPVIAAGGLFDRSELDPVSPVADDTPRLREVRPAAVASTDVEEVVPSLPVPVAELTPAATLEATEVIPPPRDYSDRVVAVDEFRARESSPSKPDRAWPRIPDRPLNERPPLDREAPVRRLKDEDFDSAILPPPAYEETPEGQRPLVLQGALLGSLCLMLGFGFGYVYRDRVAAAAAQTAAANTPVSVPLDERQAPTTGKTPAQGTDVDVPVGGAKPAPPPAAPAPAASSPKPAPPSRRREESGSHRGASGRDVDAGESGGRYQWQVERAHTAHAGRREIWQVPRAHRPAWLRSGARAVRALTINGDEERRGDAAPVPRSIA